MLDLNYVAADFFNTVNQALANGESVRVNMPKSNSLLKAIKFYDEYFSSRMNGKKNILLLIKFGWFGIRCPTLWGVLNKAEMINAKVTISEADTSLVVTIVPQP